MLLNNMFTVLLPLFDQCPVWSLMIFPPKFSKLLCKTTCKWYGGCTGVDSMNKIFQCELVYGAAIVSRDKRIQIFQVQYKHSKRRELEREVYAKYGLPTCLKVERKFHGGLKRLKGAISMNITGNSKKNKEKSKRYRCPLQKSGVAPTHSSVACTRLDRTFNGSKKREDILVGKSNETTDKMYQDSEHCILYKQTNLTYQIEENLVGQLPIKVLPGMKLTAHGSYIKGLPTTQFSTTKDPEHVKNLFKWLHTEVEWDTKQVIITEGVLSDHYNGPFPIMDPTNFSISYALTDWEAKIYVNNVLIRSLKPISFIQDYVIRRYGTVYQLLVERYGEGCGMP